MTKIRESGILPNTYQATPRLIAHSGIVNHREALITTMN
jgi:hypothetical protein